MKHFKIRVLLSLFAFSSLSCMAQDYVIPKELIVVTKANVNLRQAPNASGTIVMKAPIGTVFEMVSKQPGWYEVKEAWTGKQAFISASLVKLYANSASSFPVTEGIVASEPSEDGFEQIIKRKTSETTNVYSFWFKAKNTNELYASSTQTNIDINGRIRTYETYYKGKQMGWYIVLTEETDSDGAVQNKLEQPILIFKDASGKSGIYIQGVYYKEGGNPFE